MEYMWKWIYPRLNSKDFITRMRTCVFGHKVHTTKLGQSLNQCLILRSKDHFGFQGFWMLNVRILGSIQCFGLIYADRVSQAFKRLPNAIISWTVVKPWLCYQFQRSQMVSCQKIVVAVACTMSTFHPRCLYERTSGVEHAMHRHHQWRACKFSLISSPIQVENGRAIQVCEGHSWAPEGILQMHPKQELSRPTARDFSCAWHNNSKGCGVTRRTQPLNFKQWSCKQTVWVAQVWMPSLFESQTMDIASQVLRWSKTDPIMSISIWLCLLCWSWQEVGRLQSK